MPNGVARKKLSDRFFSMSAVKASNTQGCHQQKIEHEMLEKYKTQLTQTHKAKVFLLPGNILCCKHVRRARISKGRQRPFTDFA